MAELESPRPARVLIVDDVEENLKVLTETLTESGFNPLQAKDGARAIQIAQKAQPEIILLDIQMPGMDGFETIRRLKDDPLTREIPVIFISALNEIEDKVRGFHSGAVDYVSKPFRREEVVARVGTHLRLRQALREVEAGRRKARELLLNVIPEAVADELERKGSFEPHSYPDVSVLFSDFTGFTSYAETRSAAQLIAELNELFTAFDAIMDQNGCERIKTIGDAYLAVGGMHEAHPDHPARMATAALQMVRAVEAHNQRIGAAWRIRVGLHCGEVIGGIVGLRKYLFDIFGDTVNTASRMESECPPMKVNVSAVFAARLDSRFLIEARAPVTIKGKGEMEMALVKDVNG